VPHPAAAADAQLSHITIYRAHAHNSRQAEELAAVDRLRYGSLLRLRQPAIDDGTVRLVARTLGESKDCFSRRR
jgi:hypothetical protein